MVDYDTLVASLRERGYTVERVIPVPSNAGEAELIVNGKTILLAEARALLELPPTR